MQAFLDSFSLNTYLLTLSFSAEHNYVQASWMPYLEGVAGVVAIGIFVFSVTLGVKILNARNHTSDLNPDLIATTDGRFIHCFGF